MPTVEEGEGTNKGSEGTAVPPPRAFEWSRAVPWLGTVVMVFSAGVSSALLLSTKVDRAEVLELGKKVDELKSASFGLDKSICLSNQKVDYMNDRLVSD